MSTKTLWFVVDMSDDDEESPTIEDRLENIISTYTSDAEELYEEVGLASVKEIHFDTLITDRKKVAEKIEDLSHEQWNLGWNLVSRTISEAGGLYIKNTWTPYNQHPHPLINWWDVRLGATILDGFPTMRSLFIVGFNPADWTTVFDMENMQDIALVQISFRV